MKKNYLSRRKFNTQILIGALGLTTTQSLLAQNNFKLKGEINWFNAKDIGVEGKGWTDTKRYFDRLPRKAEGIVRDPVWDLSRHSAGMCYDLKRIHQTYISVINYI